LTNGWLSAIINTSNERGDLNEDFQPGYERRDCHVCVQQLRCCVGCDWHVEPQDQRRELFRMEGQAAAWRGVLLPLQVWQDFYLRVPQLPRDGADACRASQRLHELR